VATFSNGVQALNAILTTAPDIGKAFQSTISDSRRCGAWAVYGTKDGWLKPGDTLQHVKFVHSGSFGHNKSIATKNKVNLLRDAAGHGFNILHRPNGPRY
jgi:hypothetical protein